jgi:hypothetical protein
MYSSSITNDGATIAVMTDPNGPHKTRREAWLQIAKELKDIPKHKHVALWIEVNLPTLKPNCPYSFSHY